MYKYETLKIGRFYLDLHFKVILSILVYQGWYLQNFLQWRHATQHDDIQLNDTQHNGLICDTQHNNALPLSWVSLCWVSHFIFVMMNVIMLMSLCWCHYADVIMLMSLCWCHYGDVIMLMSLCWCHHADVLMLGVIMLSVVAPLTIIICAGVPYHYSDLTI